MILGDNEKKPHIKYPCKWNYKVIGNNIDGILFAIEETADGLSYEVTPSNISREGKYYSLNFEIQVENEASRNAIYQQLLSFESVKMVL